MKLYMSYYPTRINFFISTLKRTLRQGILQFSVSCLKTLITRLMKHWKPFLFIVFLFGGITIPLLTTISIKSLLVSLLLLEIIFAFIIMVADMTSLFFRLSIVF